MRTLAISATQLRLSVFLFSFFFFFVKKKRKRTLSSFEVQAKVQWLLDECMLGSILSPSLQLAVSFFFTFFFTFCLFVPSCSPFVSFLITRFGNTLFVLSSFVQPHLRRSVISSDFWPRKAALCCHEHLAL